MAAMKPEVLFLAHRIPYPPDKGDKIRSWRLLNFLTQRYRVHLCCFVDDKRDLAHRTHLEMLCETVALIPISPKFARLKSITGFLTNRPLSVAFYNDRRMRKAVAAARARPLAAEFAFSSTMAQYIEERGLHARPRIVDFCDADSEKWRQYSKHSLPFLADIYAREAQLLAEEETMIANWAEASFAISPQEAKVFNEREGAARAVDWFANGVDITVFDPAAADFGAAPSVDCVFTGAMDYRANVDAVLHFVRKVWPRVRKAKSDATFAIVGANPLRSIRKLHGKKGITVTGRVEDVRPWLWGAGVAVAPLRVGRGVQNKVLEAMAMGKAIVASTAAMTGIDAPATAAFVCDDPQEAAERILALLGDETARQTAGDAARRFVIEHYDWTRALSRLEKKLEALGL